MNRWTIAASALPLACLMLSSPLPGKAAATNPRSATAITCNWPVGPNDSARTLLRRFGRQARMADIGIGEGETERGVELFFRDPRRRMEVLFWDPARRHPEKVQFGDERAPWTVAGIRIGDSLASVRRKNGRRFTLQEFGADYEGTIGSFEGGTLETVMGGCEPWMIFDPNYGETMPDGLDGIMGDGETNSDHPAMAKISPTVGALGIRYAAPPEMRQDH